jgi:predicted metal-binding membrane protein
MGWNVTTPSVDATLEALVWRDRLVVVAVLAAVIALSWAYLLGDMSMMMRAVWTPGHAVMMFFVWWVMMVAMMLPGTAPVILSTSSVPVQPQGSREASSRSQCTARKSIGPSGSALGVGNASSMPERLRRVADGMIPVHRTRTPFA